MVHFNLQELPFSYDALEPYISSKTLSVHHDKHHKTYLDKFNAALDAENVEEESIIEMFKNISSYSRNLRNNCGGFWNHQFYFESLEKEKNFENYSKIKEKIMESFGSYENFKDEFSKSATTLFGSGWTWLGVKEDGNLIIHNTRNQDNTYMDVINEKYTPLLVLDVWEHAYYLDYENRRPEYIENFFNVINWAKVEDRLINS